MHALRPTRPALELARQGLLMTLALTLTTSAPSMAAKKQPVAERYEMRAANLDRGRAGIIIIGIREFSTDEDRDALLAAFAEGGNNRLDKTLAKIKPENAFIKLPQTASYPLRYVYEIEVEGKRVITLATERPITGINNSRANFSVIRLVLDEDGSGTGRMFVGAEFRMKKNGEIVMDTVANTGTEFTTIKRTT